MLLGIARLHMVQIESQVEKRRAALSRHRTARRLFGNPCPQPSQQIDRLGLYRYRHREGPALGGWRSTVLQPGQRLAMFDQRLQIGHDLARMRPVGQAVDHRHARIVRQFLDLGVIVGADHDRIDHPAKHAGGIGNRFPASDLGCPRIHDQRRSAQLTHRHVERDAGAGAVLFKDHRQHAVLERGVGIDPALCTTRPRGLARDRIVQNCGEPVAPRIGQFKKVLYHHAASGGWKLAAPADSLSMNSSIWLSSITSGGSQ
mgnify:CR=1 FL=1